MVVLYSRSKGWGKSLTGGTVFLGNTLYPLLSTGSTREDPYRHIRKKLTGT